MREQILERLLKYKWSPFSRTAYLKKHGVVPIVRGEGAKLYDIDGREYIDGHAGLWLVNVGYGRREIVDAVHRQMQQLPWFSSFEGYTNLPSVDLAERLVHLLRPEAMDKVFFSGSGSEAVDTALKVTRQFWKLQGKPERFKVIARNRAYHGVTFGGLSATGIPANRAMFEPLLPGFLHVPSPDTYLREVDAPEGRFALACAQTIERLIETEGADTVAAVIVEPVQGAGGVIVPPPGYLKEVEAICRRHGVLLVLDEVITGFGRTGAWFGARQWDIRPDILVMAKGITSGYLPLGATAVTERVWRVFEENERVSAFRHGNTYSGHPAACAAAMVNIDILERERLPDNAREVGAHFLEKLRQVSHHAIVGHVDGIGLLARVQLVRDRKSRAGFPAELEVADRVARRMRELGVIVRALPRDIVSFSPPLCLTRAEAERIAAVVDEAIEAVAKEPDVKSQWTSCSTTASATG
jgi:adenosylmethionine-8-amino-7-oxononanoate aminotransferase